MSRAGGERSWREVFLVFLGLGLTSFGGPIAHIGYFRRALVERRGWLEPTRFASLLALCQTLPGPTSSQLGIAIGHERAGWRGAVAAWAAFTLPSALLMILFAWGARWGQSVEGWSHGLKLAAVAVVAQAVLVMGRQFVVDGRSLMIALLALAALLLAPGAATQFLVIAAGAALGTLLLRRGERLASPTAPERGRTGNSLLLLLLFLLLLLASFAVIGDRGAAGQLAAYYRTGALVFGGGHVVLPLLEQGVVATGAVDRHGFLAAYGAAQALPGPLFTIAAYPGFLGEPGGLAGAALAVVAIFLPGALLLVGVLPHWSRLTSRAGVRPALAGTNAAVVGLLAAALYDPLWLSSIRASSDLLVAAGAFALLTIGRASPLPVVLVCALAGSIMEKGL